MDRCVYTTLCRGGNKVFNMPEQDVQNLAGQVQWTQYDLYLSKMDIMSGQSEF